MNDVIALILKRRTIRIYKPQKVEEEKLKLLLQAAMAAPNAANIQPWEFIVVTEEDILSQLRSGLYAGHYNAPAAIVVCGSEKAANHRGGSIYWVQDCSAATQNILIAAVGMGLGTAWIGVYPLPSVIKPVSRILNLPENVIPLSVVFVGYPAEAKAPRTQYDEKRIYWQRYEPRKKRARVKNAKYLP